MRRKKTHQTNLMGFFIFKKNMNTNITIDDIIHDLESRGLGWSLDHTGRIIEARVWAWPYVIGRYRPCKVEPLIDMLSQAMYGIDWEKYPVRLHVIKTVVSTQDNLMDTNVTVDPLIDDLERCATKPEKS